MWISNFLVSASATMILPYLSLYIDSMGSYSGDFVQRWAGYVFSVTFVTAFIFSPMWGRFGDRHGYKPILMITGYGIALCIFLMGFAESVYTLFFLRMAMGAVTGFIPTSMALIVSQTPKETAGKTLGTLQTGTVTGGLCGPLIGGLLADTFGFEYTFILTAGGISLAATAVAFGVHESKKENKKEKEKTYNRRQVLSYIFKNPVLISVMLISTCMQAANFSIQPLLALYVGQLTHGNTIAFLAGLVFSSAGFGNLLSARHWGNLGDRIGYEKVIMMLLVSAAIIVIPQSFVTELWQLMLLRFMQGIALGGLLPCITAYIRQAAPASMQGEILGYNVSFRFLGNVIGPTAGGIVASIAGISSVFFLTSSLFLTGFALLWWSKMKETQAG
ncbi:MFS transporter [Peribacillus saganii]|uniref:MFS transporter n=1 Tax=Peribacillus saganii TaxID=2303992 RepID=A0A372LPW8_9BACI|nr:MFS transporter [Peribacillus saganii]RFU70160.1 MFS transporter [Peribacillus saganii]